MLLGKKLAGSAPGHTWENDGDVIDVDDVLALELIAIPGGGFYEARAAEPDAGEAEPDTEPVVEAPTAKAAKRPARGKATTAASGPQDAPPSADIVAE